MSKGNVEYWDKRFKEEVKPLFERIPAHNGAIANYFLQGVRSTEYTGFTEKYFTDVKEKVKNTVIRDYIEDDSNQEDIRRVIKYYLDWNKLTFDERNKIKKERGKKYSKKEQELTYKQFNYIYVLVDKVKKENRLYMDKREVENKGYKVYGVGYKERSYNYIEKGLTVEDGIHLIGALKSWVEDGNEDKIKEMNEEVLKKIILDEIGITLKDYLEGYRVKKGIINERDR